MSTPRLLMVARNGAPRKPVLTLRAMRRALATLRARFDQLSLSDVAALTNEDGGGSASLEVALLARQIVEVLKPAVALGVEVETQGSAAVHDRVRRYQAKRQAAR